MCNIIKNGLIICSLIGCTIGVVFWVEAEKELVILCSMIEENQSETRVENLIATAALSNYQSNGTGIQMSSPYMLNSSTCIIEIEDAIVTQDVVYISDYELRNVMSIMALVLTILLIGFQMALAFGAPLGEWAWGGFHKKLPSSLKRASAVSSALLFLLALAVWSIEFQELIPSSISVYIVLAFVILFLLSTVGNLTSRSKKERLLMTPVSILLFLSCFAICYATF
jgi:hypothetical protein